jgi:hypothetical protein
VVYWRDTGDRSEDTDPIEAALDGWTYGRNEDERAANRAIARWSLEWLQDNGVAQQADVPLAEAAEDDPEGRTPDTLWRSVIREAWEHAAKQGYVEQPHSRAYKWAGEG